MVQAVEQFRNDHGYIPPILDDDRDLFYPFNASDTGLATGTVNDWYSITSPAEYLVGYGHHYQDGYGIVPGGGTNKTWPAETPATGIRSPGPDGVWNATRNGGGGLGSRMLFNGAQGMENSPFPIDQGTVYGPYLEIGSERLLGALDENGNIVFPGDANYTADLPKVIVDDWGTPIRYYRQVYPWLAGPATAVNETVRFADRNGDGLHDPVGLDAIIALRPQQIPVGEETDSVNYDGVFFTDDTGDPTTSKGLRSAEFAFLSAGPDRRLNDERRVDEFNLDNIVEISR